MVTPESKLRESAEFALTGRGQAVAIKEINSTEPAIAVKNAVFNFPQ